MADKESVETGTVESLQALSILTDMFQARIQALLLLQSTH
jgi:hypothetical protein